MKSELQTGRLRQFSTFYVADRLYGIDVTEVQEVAKPLPITPIHLAPSYVLGLINLRGQIATAIDLRGLFGLSTQQAGPTMSVVCRFDDALLSLQVDQIDDVVEVSDDAFEPTPLTVDQSTRCFLKGVYKVSKSILSIIEIEKINQFLVR